MGWKGTLRAMEAAQRRQQREAQKRQRELERQNKEQTELSAIEQARLEVETHENKLEVLLSVHKEQGEIWDWIALAASLPPPCPQKNSNQELKTKQLILVSTSRQKEGSEAAIERSRLQDEQVFQEAMQAYLENDYTLDEFLECFPSVTRELARRVLESSESALLTPVAA
jgi:hypothetical protein